MTQMFNAQMEVLRREVDAWRNKVEDVQREMQRREDLARDAESRMRDKYENQIDTLVTRSDNELQRYQDKIELQQEAAKREHERDIERLQDRLESANRERDDARERTRNLELELLRSGFEFKINEAELKAVNTSGPSEHVRDTAELMKVAKEIGVDPGIVFRKEMGYEEDKEDPEKKPGLAESLFKELGPAITQGLKGQLMGANASQSPGLTNTANSPGEAVSPLGLPSEEF
jgi:hypothetical protein